MAATPQNSSEARQTRQSGVTVTENVLSTSGASDATTPCIVHTARSRPAAPPASANSSPSTSSCRRMAVRPAPRARRIAISLRRLPARASCMLATLRLATSRTASAAPRSAANETATSLSTGSGGWLPWLSPVGMPAVSTGAPSPADLVDWRFADSARRAALAESTDKPGCSRPTIMTGTSEAAAAAVPRRGRPLSRGAAPIGTQKSGPTIRTGPANRSGATPMTVNGRAFTTTVRPRMSARPPIRCHAV